MLYGDLMAITPTLLSDESFVLCYQTGKTSEKSQKKINLISIKLPTTAISILQPDFDTLKAKMRLMQSVKRKCGRL